MDEVFIPKQNTTLAVEATKLGRTYSNQKFDLFPYQHKHKEEDRIELKFASWVPFNMKQEVELLFLESSLHSDIHLSYAHKPKISEEINTSKIDIQKKFFELYSSSFSDSKKIHFVEKEKKKQNLNLVESFGCSSENSDFEEEITIDFKNLIVIPTENNIQVNEIFFGKEILPAFEFYAQVSEILKNLKKKIFQESGVDWEIDQKMLFEKISELLRFQRGLTRSVIRNVVLSSKEGEQAQDLEILMKCYQILCRIILCRREIEEFEI